MIISEGFLNLFLWFSDRPILVLFSLQFFLFDMFMNGWLSLKFMCLQVFVVGHKSNADV